MELGRILDRLSCIVMVRERLEIPCLKHLLHFHPATQHEVLFSVEFFCPNRSNSHIVVLYLQQTRAQMCGIQLTAIPITRTQSRTALEITLLSGAIPDLICSEIVCSTVE